MPDAPIDLTGLAPDDSLMASLNRLQAYLAERIRELDMSQAEVARRTGITPQRLSQILTSERTRIPEVELLERLAAALRLPRRVLLHIAAESYRYVLPDPDDETSLLVASLEELPEDRRRDIARIVELYRQEADDRDRRRRTGGGDKP